MGDRAGLITRMTDHQKAYDHIAARLDRVLALFRTEQPVFSVTERPNRLADATESDTQILTRG